MNDLGAIGLGHIRSARPPAGGTEYVQIQRPLQRVLAFRGRSIDDVVNDRFVKNEILGYWKLHKQVLRACEVVELEQQWNSASASRR